MEGKKRKEKKKRRRSSKRAPEHGGEENLFQITQSTPCTTTPEVGEKPNNQPEKKAILNRRKKEKQAGVPSVALGVNSPKKYRSYGKTEKEGKINCAV